MMKKTFRKTIKTMMLVILVLLLYFLSLNFLQQQPNTEDINTDSITDSSAMGYYYIAALGVDGKDHLIRIPVKENSVKNGPDTPTDPVPGGYELSEYMIGKIAVSIIFLESTENSSNTENWTTVEQGEVINETMAAMNWYKSMEPKAQLNFTYENHTIPVDYEPIQGECAPDASCVASDVADTLTGTNGDGGIQGIWVHLNQLRNQTQSDWAIMIIIADGENDSDSAFSDGVQGCAMLGGACTYLASRTINYNCLRWLIAHEVAHLFYAVDEYSGGLGDHSGYFCTPNNNHEDENPDPEPCIMRSLYQHALCNFTRHAIGWSDEDNSNIMDIFEYRVVMARENGTCAVYYRMHPTITINPSFSLTNNPSPCFNGSVYVNTCYNANTYCTVYGSIRDITIDKITDVEYNIDNTTWLPADGVFDTWNETFNITLSSLSDDFHNLTIRVMTRFNQTNQTSLSFVVDTTPPEINDCYPLNDNISLTVNETDNITFTVNATDNLSSNLTYHWYQDSVLIPDIHTPYYTYQTNYSSAGNHTFTVSVLDEAGNVNSTIWDNVVVLNVNRPIVIQSYTPISNSVLINETENMLFNLIVFDPDTDDIITIQWYLNESLVTTGDSYIFVSDYESAGTYTVNVTVSDGEYNVSHEWTLTVINVNRAPVIETYSPETDPTITEEQNQTFNITTSDPDDDPLTTEWYLNSTLVDTGTSYTFTGNYTSAGWYEVKVVVSDGSLYVNYIWTLTVINVNRAPFLTNPLPDRLFDEDHTLTAFNLNDYFSDPDNETLTYMVYGNDNISILMNSNGTVDFSASENWYGNEIITFRVTDPYNRWVEDTIIVTVNPVNDPPVITPCVGDRQTYENTPFIINLTGNQYDMDNETKDLVWSVTNTNTSLFTVIIDQENDTILINPLLNQSGTHTITIHLSDGLLEDTENITITILHINHPPTIVGIPTPQHATEDTPLYLDVSSYVSDVDNSTDELTVSTNSSYATVNGSIIIFNYPNGILSENVRITVTDGINTSYQDIMVVVTPINDAPVINSFTPVSNPTINEGEEQVFIVSSSDVDNTDLTITWYLDGNPVATGNTYVFLTNYNMVGEYTVTVQISDNTTHVNKTWNITIVNVNRKPTDVRITRNKEAIYVNQPVTFQAHAIDPDTNDTITYHWWSIMGEYTGKNYTITFTYPGSQMVTVTVTDQHGGKNTTSMQFTVQPKIEEKNKGFISGYTSAETISTIIVMMSFFVVVIRIRRKKKY